MTTARAYGRWENTRIDAISLAFSSIEFAVLTLRLSEHDLGRGWAIAVVRFDDAILVTSASKRTCLTKLICFPRFEILPCIVHVIACWRGYYESKYVRFKY